MEEAERQEWAEKSSTLRAELKAWEKTFAAANNGQKASREDIKNSPDIAAKYKEYSKARDIIAGNTAPLKPETKPQPAQQIPRKRKREEDRPGVSKRQIIQTPSRAGIQPWAVDPYESPSVIRNLFTPIRKTKLGPTPQKDGQVLGLFDLLQADDDPSPSKENVSKTGKQVSIQATPRKSRQEDSMKHSRTPSSPGKRFMLDAFATPLKNRTLNGQGSKTPSSVSKLHFSTPSFLRRDSQRIALPPVQENATGLQLSPQMTRQPRKPLVRGLSSMLAGLRKMEADAADDDLDALREMEDEMPGVPSKPPPPKPKVTAPKVDESILVADGQPGFPLGGFDDEAQFDSEPEDVKNPPLGKDGQPLRVYKKKGQKRTTRRVNMKPTRSKPQAQSLAPADFDSDEDQATAEAVPETQVVDDEGAEFADSARNFDSDSQSEYTASEGGTRYRRPNQNKKRKVMGKDGKIKSVAKKVTAAAHQNFKRLKLRNSGAKGGIAHNSRFRRKR
ncbi:DNA replication/checkpoint protein [Amylocarpus encephaloides]|uniref:DNA replication regulator SLD2 n=1 Tax=Amylocarpus encephaloides TaxID=45428 RepID=A0A9P8C2G9_9HELO|nr:DNA replication/checkpoint protein [Amylocarpus encephaloides]